MARSYEPNYSEKNGRWHFDILLVLASVGRPSASSVVFRSEAENRRGYSTKEEATKAALAQIAKLLAD